MFPMVGKVTGSVEGPARRPRCPRTRARRSGRHFGVLGQRPAHARPADRAALHRHPQTVHDHAECLRRLRRRGEGLGERQVAEEHLHGRTAPPAPVPVPRSRASSSTPSSPSWIEMHGPAGLRPAAPPATSPPSARPCSGGKREGIQQEKGENRFVDNETREGSECLSERGDPARVGEWKTSEKPMFPAVPAHQREARMQEGDGEGRVTPRCRGV